ncbi:hypothetical protein ACFXTI_021674 [Malus domestica]
MNSFPSSEMSKDRTLINHTRESELVGQNRTLGHLPKEPESHSGLTRVDVTGARSKDTTFDSGISSNGRLAKLILRSLT